MNRTARPALLAAVAVTAAVLVAAAVGAWACVPFPMLSVEPSASAAPGTEVTVEGLDFGSAPVELRWNALDGPLLAKTQGPIFSTPVTVPESPAGIYTIVGLGRAPDGSVGAKTAASFQVTGPAAPSPDVPATVAADSGGDDSDDDGPSTAVVALGGLVLAVAGGFVGATVAGRRTRSLVERAQHDGS